MEEKVVCMGRPIIDITHKDKTICSPGGVEFNFAVGVALLGGIPTAFYGVVGNDGAHYFKRIEKDLPCLRLFLRELDGPTARIVVKMVKSRVRGGEITITKAVEYGVSEYLELVLLKAKSNLDQRTTIFTSLFSANTPRTKASWLDFVNRAMTKKGKIVISLAGIPTVSPADREEILQAVSNANVVFMNSAESTTLLGDRRESRVTQLFPRATTVITKGSEGAVIYGGGQRIEIEAYPLPIDVETFGVGAGDAFATGFICGLLKGWDSEKAGSFAAKVASIKLRFPQSYLTSGAVQQVLGDELRR